jgi:ubiquinone biosynthesis protein UbiJ
MLANKNFFIAAVEKAMNAYLALDPESARRLENLQGKVVTIELLAVGITLQLIFTGKKIELQTGSPLSPDTVIKGTPLRLLQLALTKNRRQQFFSDDVTITGNLELGQVVIDLFDHLEIDWEEILSQFCGDVAAHQLGRLGRKLQSFRKLTRRVFAENVSEYLQEEINLFPPREALQDFFQDVDQMRMDTDRLEARVNLLQQRLASSRGNE